MAVEERKTTDVLQSIFNEIDVSDLGYSELNFLFGHPQNISSKLDKNPNAMPLVVLFYQDLQEELIDESTIYMSSDVLLYVMLPFNFAKQDQSETYTNAIDPTQIIIQRIKDATETFPGINPIKNVKSNPHENWTMVFNSKSVQNNKIITLSKNVVNLNLSGRDMRFNLEILTKQKCN